MTHGQGQLTHTAPPIAPDRQTPHRQTDRLHPPPLQTDRQATHLPLRCRVLQVGQGAVGQALHTQLQVRGGRGLLVLGTMLVLLP